MDHPDEQQKSQGGPPSPQDLPPYKLSDQQLPPMVGSVPTTVGFVADPNKPCPLHYPPYGAVPGQGLVIQPPQPTTFVVPVHPTNEPDHLAYSIFTTACCFLPLGLVALVYSIETRNANRSGDGTAAQERSKKAQCFARAALGVGIVLLVLYAALFVFLYTRDKP